LIGGPGYNNQSATGNDAEDIEDIFDVVTDEGYDIGAI
jgi:hypothetical protein